ncbi:hypothetical protein NC651_033261 [Populus alba x Populus x berolinensis]|nr:hypothetical protein NC651_033261 [Populus alba x Populus x berolinensis]
MKPIVHSKSFYYYSVFGKIGNPGTGFLRLYNLGLRIFTGSSWLGKVPRGKTYLVGGKNVKYSNEVRKLMVPFV